MNHREEARRLRPILEQAVQGLDDQTALLAKAMYPTWEDCVAAGSVDCDKPGYKFAYNGDLYSCVNPNPIFQQDWVPGIDTASLYTKINETHSGTQDDPIPYEGNMALIAGLHYTQDGVVYVCIRDTGAPVYQALAALVGLYVTTA